MLIILINLFVGWLLDLIGLDRLLHYFVGLNRQGYYILWFAMGIVIWIRNAFNRRK